MFRIPPRGPPRFGGGAIASSSPPPRSPDKLEYLALFIGGYIAYKTQKK